MTIILSHSEQFPLWDSYNHTTDLLTHEVAFIASLSVGKTDAKYQNKVWDTQANGGAGGFVVWNTYHQDITGVFYPGPGVFGVDTSDYVVQAIVHGRIQT